MTVNECYGFLQFISRKNQVASLSPTEFATAFNSAQITWFDYLIGKITVNQHVVLGQNERIAERLKPFKITDELLNVSSQIVSYPTDFVAISAMVDDSTGSSLQYISDTKLRGRLNSSIDPIENAKPGVFTNASAGWKVWPATISKVLVSYYRLPKMVKWGYTQDANKRAVYDPLTSTDPEWDNLSNEEILARTCTLLGISFQQPQLVQFGQAAKQQGA